MSDILMLNKILSKTKFAITEKMDYADIMIGAKRDFTYKKWIKFIENNIDSLCIQSKINKYSKNIYIAIESKIFELYILELLEKADYNNLLKLCNLPVKVHLSSIADYQYTQIDSYFGVSVGIEALSYDCNNCNFLNKKSTNQDANNNSTKNKLFIENLYIVEERSDYIYFKIGVFVFEAKRIAGQFDLYFEKSIRDKILVATVKNKNDIFKSAKEFIASQ